MNNNKDDIWNAFLISAQKALKNGTEFQSRVERQPYQVKEANHDHIVISRREGLNSVKINRSFVTSKIINLIQAGGKLPAKSFSFTSAVEAGIVFLHPEIRFSKDSSSIEVIGSNIRHYEMTNAPSVYQYKQILSSFSDSTLKKPKEIFKAHYSLPNHAGTTQEIADATGLDSNIVVHSTYSRLAKKLCGEIGIEPDLRPDDSARWWSVWSIGFDTPKGFIWKLHPNFVIALEQLGWISAHHYSSPDEIELPDEVLTEGSIRQVKVNAYERNPEARRKCIEHYGTQCSVCSFDFGEFYGVEANGFIHVHHLKRIADIGQKYEIDPLNDLRPVCANCHAMIHLGNGCRSIEEVKEMMRVQSN
jgi:5-methylcytosine-specific restriction enzyme A